MHNVQDWDDPDGAIDWPRLRTFLQTVKRSGKIPDDHKSHDHLNEQKLVPVSEEVFDRWRNEFEKIEADYRKKGQLVTWGLLDGFLLYWDQVSDMPLCTRRHRLMNVMKGVIDTLEARLFLRVPHDILQHRRNERHGYHTAGKPLSPSSPRPRCI